MKGRTGAQLPDREADISRSCSPSQPHPRQGLAERKEAKAGFTMHTTEDGGYLSAFHKQT